MDRTLVYPGSIPLDTDILLINRNIMVALGYLARATLGDSPVVDGLGCTPTSPTALSVTIAPGSITQLSVIDPLTYGSMAAVPSMPLVKMGINTSPTIFPLAAPTSTGHSTNYLIQASFQEADSTPVVLPYFNAANPEVAYSGPDNSGQPQHTVRSQRVQLQLKAGVPAITGTQVTPPVDNGWVGLFVVTVAYGDTNISTGSIVPHASAPFLGWKLPQLHPGFGAGSCSFASSGTFVVPAGVSQVEVEVWGGGAGTFASSAGAPSGGGAGGGYAKKRVTGLIPGQTISVTVANGGNAGTIGGNNPTNGGTTSFGPYVSATGGSLNYLATSSAPQHGGTPAGTGMGGDINLTGSAGGGAFLNQGGFGGAAPMGGGQNSGTTGVPGIFPGGGASGAGTGADGQTRYNGAAGAPGFVMVRW